MTHIQGINQNPEKYDHSGAATHSLGHDQSESFDNEIIKVYGQDDDNGVIADLERTAPEYLDDKSVEINSGETPGKGNYSCTNCGTDITLNDGDRMPICPRCKNLKFTRLN